MTFDKFLKEGRIDPHRASREEVSSLFKVIERDLKDAEVSGISGDRRFAIAYNAALQSATIFMHCLGFRAKGEGHHFTTFLFMEKALNGLFRKEASYFNACRIKRNRTDYDRAGEISEKEAKELLAEAKKLYQKIKTWLKENYPQYL
jgi:uncharacterized protein (UPF0332 family)